MAPQAARGDQASADSKIQVCIRTLEDAFGVYRSHTPEGRACMKAIQALTKQFGGTEETAQKPMAAEIKAALMDQGGGAGAPPAPPGGPGAAPGALPPGGPPGGPTPG